MAETEQTQTEQTQAEQTQAEQTREGQTESQQQTEAQNAEFAEAQDTGPAPGEENLDLLLDISMPVAVNLGKTDVPFRRLLQLGPGSVLQLDKTIGQPAELYVQDINFATGDIVVVDGCFAVRIKEILGAEQGAPEQVDEDTEQK
jgi:flagellar motor switch protein FliN/FliY